MHRRGDIRESIRRLLDWDKGQAPSERMSSLLVSMCGYEGINPSHPNGGPDGGEDIVCYKNGKKCIAACYFPRGQKVFAEIERKFNEDYGKAVSKGAKLFIFVTNQELRLSERESLSTERDVDVHIVHLETIACLLNSPVGYGIRLEFLDIEMTKEEQLAFFAARDKKLSDIERVLEGLTKEKTAGTTSTPIVRPLILNDRANPLSLPLSYHQCSHCQFGFVVLCPGGYSPILTAVPGFLSPREVVRCPNCGNCDPFNC